MCRLIGCTLATPVLTTADAEFLQTCPDVYCMLLNFGKYFTFNVASGSAYELV